MNDSVADLWHETLDSLKPHSNVAVLILQGSLCPITLAHTQCFDVARQVLLRKSGIQPPPSTEVFAAVFGVVALNGDGHVQRKMGEAGFEGIDKRNRQHLVKLSIQDIPWMAFADRSDRYWDDLARGWPQLNFIFYYLNGADDVVRYRKWKDACESYRLFTVGRPGSTDHVGTPEGGPSPYFIVGPELPDISSSRVRELLRHGDKASLAGLLHPDVAAWCIENKVFQGTSSQSSGWSAGWSAGWSSWTDWASCGRKRWKSDDKASTSIRYSDEDGQSAWPPQTTTALPEAPAPDYVRKFRGVLSDLPTGSFVAILRLQGSLCPVTRAHIQCFALAREVLLRQRETDLPDSVEDFKAVVGLIACNSDLHVSHKLKGAGWGSLGLQTRSKLIDLATEDLPWLAPDDRSDDAIQQVREHFPLLNFIYYELNGADDVLKYRKWEFATSSKRLFTMGRPGSSHELGKLANDCRWSIVGPEVEDISSTQVRELIVSLRAQGVPQEEAVAELSRLLHPNVARYCLENDLIRRLPAL